MKKEFISPEMEILLFDEIEVITDSGNGETGETVRASSMDTSVDMAKDALGRNGVRGTDVTVVEANSLLN